MLLQSTLYFFNRFNKFSPSESEPITPIIMTLQPKDERFNATFAAPPGLKSILFTSTIGTGASGEILSVCPHKYLSNIRSPITNTVLL